MMGRCARSKTGKNLKYLERETGLDPWTAKAWCVIDKVKRVEVPMGEGWRIQYLSKLLHAMKELETKCQYVEELNALIESLCNS